MLGAGSPTGRRLIACLSSGARPQVDPQDKFARIVQFLRSQLGQERVVRTVGCLLALVDKPARQRAPDRPFHGCRQFVYVREAFSPSLDEKIATLYQV